MKNIKTMTKILLSTVLMSLLLGRADAASALPFQFKSVDETYRSGILVTNSNHFGCILASQGWDTNSAPIPVVDWTNQVVVVFTALDFHEVVKVEQSKNDVVIRWRKVPPPRVVRRRGRSTTEG